MLCDNNITIINQAHLVEHDVQSGSRGDFVEYDGQSGSRHDLVGPDNQSESRCNLVQHGHGPPLLHQLVKGEDVVVVVLLVPEFVEENTKVDLDLDLTIVIKEENATFFNMIIIIVDIVVVAFMVVDLVAYSRGTGFPGIGGKFSFSPKTREFPK